MTPLPPLPRSDSPEADAAIELVFAERAYPCNPKAAARAGWEAAARRAQQAVKAERKAVLLWAAELCDKDAEAIWEGPDESVPGYQELLVLRDKLRAEVEKIK